MFSAPPDHLVATAKVAFASERWRANMPTASDEAFMRHVIQRLRPNRRATPTSGTIVSDDPRVAAAYLDRTPLDAPVRPLRSSRPTYWIYHEIWRLLTQVRSYQAFIDRLGTIARGRDAVFDWHDALPFLMLHHLHIPLLLIADLHERRGWVRIDFNIGKLVQSGGD